MTDTDIDTERARVNDLASAFEIATLKQSLRDIETIARDREDTHPSLSLMRVRTVCRDTLDYFPEEARADRSIALVEAEIRSAVKAEREACALLCCQFCLKGARARRGAGLDAGHWFHDGPPIPRHIVYLCGAENIRNR